MDWNVLNLVISEIFLWSRGYFKIALFCKCWIVKILFSLYFRLPHLPFVWGNQIKYFRKRPYCFMFRTLSKALEFDLLSFLIPHLYFSKLFNVRIFCCYSWVFYWFLLLLFCFMFQDGVLLSCPGLFWTYFISLADLEYLLSLWLSHGRYGICLLTFVHVHMLHTHKISKCEKHN